MAHKSYYCRETDVVLTLKLEDTSNTVGNNYKHIPALPEVLPIANSLDFNRPSTTYYSITNQTSEAGCNETASLDGAQGSVFLHDSIRVFLGRWKVYRAIQIVEPAALSAHILYPSHYLVSADHARDQQLYVT